jgi:acetyl-CoA C-acetyltransferase
MSGDDRAPVIVGVAQRSHRVDRGAEPREPARLMADVVRDAAVDAAPAVGPEGLLARTGSVRVVALLSWKYRDPAAAVAAQLGLGAVHTGRSAPGGQQPQALLSGAAADIAAGRADVVVLTGAETWRTVEAARRDGVTLPWTVQGDEVPPAPLLGDDLDPYHPVEIERGVRMPVEIYPLFEHALRGAAGRTPAEHAVHLGELWAGANAVATRNPHAWIQEPWTAEEIRTPSPSNRIVGHPYTKVMNSNNHVEQAAAVVLCSVAAARSLGIAEDRWVYPHATTSAANPPVSERADLSRSAAVAACAAALRELGLEPTAADHVDLYSCFPSAVQVAARELGIDVTRRPFTVTGGMSFAGGPWNNYVMHALATLVGVLRADPGRTALCSANGGFLTKQVLGWYSTEPPAAGFRHVSAQAAADADPHLEVVGHHEGAATVETYTVVHGRDGAPERGIVLCRTPDDARGWGVTTEPDELAGLLAGDPLGSAVLLGAAGSFRLGATA